MNVKIQGKRNTVVLVIYFQYIRYFKTCKYTRNALRPKKTIEAFDDGTDKRRCNIVVLEERKLGMQLFCKHIMHKDNAKEHELCVFLLMKNGFL